ncbi:hypothetical protein AX15_003320 [Amanita polypyramis BW_CC]|nr:hypothetical protein AX15_003320 [Amanita polypyramis BW_CC]
MSRTTASSLNVEKPQLHVQINQIDYTLEPPGQLDNVDLPRVPIIRIYGASSFGEIACVHIHQVYPYFYVDYLGRLDPHHVKHYTATLARSLNHAIALSLRRNPNSLRSQYVRAVLPVKGVPFYGFHERYSPFLKIYLMDPAIVNRAVAVIQSGTVMNTRFRTYENHLGFILQFMCDFNLYGCGSINLGRVFLRGAEQFPEGEECQTRYDFTPSPYYCQARSPLEVDVIAPHILNRLQLESREMHHKLEIPEPLLSKEPLISSVRELWDDERKRRLAQGLGPTPEMPLDPSESSRNISGGWVTEDRWREKLGRRMQEESEVGYENGCTPREWEAWVMSTFESIEALWEQEYRTWEPVQQQFRRDVEENLRIIADMTSGNQNVDIQVDVDMLSSQEVKERFLAEEEEKAEVIFEFPAEGPYNQGEEASDQECPSSPKSSDDTSAVDGPGVVDGGFTLSEAGAPGPNPESFARISPAEANSTCPRTPKEVSSEDQVYRFNMSPLAPTGQVTRKFPKELLSTPTRKRTLPPSGSDEVVPSWLSSPESPSRHHITRPLKRQRHNTPISLDFVAISSTPDPEVVGVKQMAQFVRHHSYTAMKSSSLNRYEYGHPHPTTTDLLRTFESYNLPDRIYREPYYSDSSDAPRGVRAYAGLVYRPKGGPGVAYLEEWNGTSDNYEVQERLLHCNLYLESTGLGGWEYSSYPPNVKQTKKWLQMNKRLYSATARRLHSQIEGPSPKNIYGLGTSPGPQNGNIRETQRMSILSLEVFVPTKDGKVPDPGEDQIAALFYAFQKLGVENIQSRTIVVSTERLNKSRTRSVALEEVSSELDLLNSLVDTVIDLDPDIITGWEVQQGSWGFVSKRATYYGYELSDLISRAPIRQATNENEQWNFLHTSTIKIAGRHVLNAWRIMRSEQSLNIYTLENVVFHVLRRRIPHFSQLTLTNWFQSSVTVHPATLLRYFSSRTLMVLEILDEVDFVTKTAEFARVFGVDFFSVIGRGSQFKVESFMFRIAKAENYVLLSPSKSDVGKQNAAECMPLIMEPTSAFYSSPLVVLDFQSLYPSVMIAYNYCYSTCLGRINDLKSKNKFGVVDLNLPPGVFSMLKEHIQIAPNGVMYVKPKVRTGLLGKMLTELLETRVMVKQAMKSAKDNKPLLRVLNARQLGLKYICNVTYGYTSATYSGRMPAVEIADSVVQSGRETLEKGSLMCISTYLPKIHPQQAITVINSTKKWGARVVYGDTDSVFVYLPGKTNEQAFRIGHDIADTITAINPSPIKLKFEKVYHPCVLLAKKRYVGFKYESPDQIEPIFDAKGIETVRRDGVPAQQKMTESCIRMLFRSQDLSKIKAYCYRSWAKLFDDRASVRDFIFSKEVKMGTYRGPLLPGVTVAKRKMLFDPNNEPQYGERVPYVITKGPPGSGLVERAMDPLDFVQNGNLRLDATFYITRVLIPPLERILNLVGADVRQWYNDMPKPSQVVPTMSPKKSMTVNINSPSKINISDHFLSSQCLICNAPTLDESMP